MNHRTHPSQSPAESSSAPQNRALPGDSRPAFSAAVVFCAVFAVFGVHAPYFPIWLAKRGLEPWEIGLVLSLPLLLRPAVAPVIGRLADQRSDRRGLLVFLALVTLAFAAALSQVHLVPIIISLSSVMILAYQPIAPIADATVGSLVRRGVVASYGRLRLWGSASFAIVAVIAGLVLNRFGIEAVFMGYVVLIGIAAASMYLLPSAGGAARRELATPFYIWRRPALAAVLVSVSLITASQAMYFAFGSVQMLKLGYPDWSIGLLWTVAVVAEIVVLWFAPSLLRRIGPYSLLMLAAITTSFRWLGMALDPPIWITVLLQTLHAGTLSCTLLALMAFIERLVEDEASARAQSISVTLTGLMNAGMFMLNGPLYQSYGGKAYFAGAILPALAIVILLAFRQRLGGRVV